MAGIEQELAKFEGESRADYQNDNFISRPVPYGGRLDMGLSDNNFKFQNFVPYDCEFHQFKGYGFSNLELISKITQKITK